MPFIDTLLGIPLGRLFYLCYAILGNYGFSIFLFTLIIKAILFPLSLASQSNSIKMVKLQPILADLKERYFDTPSLYMQEIKKLYKRERYNTFIGILPLLVQIPIVLGVIQVMYNPLRYLLRMDKEAVAAMAETAGRLTGGEMTGAGVQLRIFELVKDNPAAFAATVDGQTIGRIQGVNLNFWGIQLSALPSFDSGPLMLVVLASCVSAFLMCLLQNRYNVLSKEQGFVGKWGTTAFLVAFSGYFAFVVPAAIGIYWTASNLLTIAVLFICNGVYNPKKYIDYENRSQKKVALTKVEKAVRKHERSVARVREKADTARFYRTEKSLVFYSESGGFYKYFEAIIEYVLAHSDIIVHYVTSDLHDRVLDSGRPNFETYYVAGNALIPFMMRMEADMVVMTMPDLERYHIKRSLVRKDIEYVYLDHGMTSFHLMLREGALDHYDTIFCYGPNHVEEIRAMERVYGLPAKKLVNTGYGLLDILLKNVTDMPKEENEVKKVLIAPSWQKDNILEYCLPELLNPLLNQGYRIILRPHPEFVKRFPSRMSAIITKYGNRQDEGLIVESDFSSNESVYTADLVITDWSSIAQEFSYATKRPSLFINTPMKIMNPEYKKIPLVPLDISLRDEIGVSVEVADLHGLPALVKELFASREEWHARIEQVVAGNIFNIGTSDKAAGEYIIQTVNEKAAGKGGK